MFTGYAWTENFPNCGTLFGVGANRTDLEIDSPGLSPHLAHHNDRLFGYRHVPDLIADLKMWAVIRGAGSPVIAICFWPTADFDIRSVVTVGVKRDAEGADSPHPPRYRASSPTRCASSAASASSQLRNVVIFGRSAAALGATIQ
jgi:hypothetical protein